MAYSSFLETTFFRDLAKTSLNDDFATALNQTAWNLVRLLAKILSKKQEVPSLFHDEAFSFDCYCRSSCSSFLRGRFLRANI
jgi:hypothetical protein